MKLVALLLMIFVAEAELDICVPSFPQIRGEFMLSPFKTEILLSANLLFHCLAALFVGSLADQHGKIESLTWD